MPRRLLALALALLGAGLLAVALTAPASRPDPGVSDRVVLPFGPAPTIPEPAPVPAADEFGEQVQTPGTAPAVQVRSGLIDALPAAPSPEPVRLVIGDIAVDAPVADVGYDARRQEMEVPGRADLVGWYRFSASPGGPGSAVLAAHVDFDRRAGAFFRLHELEQGTRLTVVLDDGTRQRWEVVARRQYHKELLPTDAIFARDGAPTLALITCGGPFDGRSYEDNVVVFARPVGAPAGAVQPAGV